MFWRSTYLRHILAAQAFLCILLGYNFFNLAFAMRRNWFILFIVIDFGREGGIEPPY